MAGGVNFICIVTVWCLLQYTGCATGSPQKYDTELAARNITTLTGMCDCGMATCDCCVTLPIIHYTACIRLTYLKKDAEILFAITVDGKTVISKKVSVRDPVSACINVPYLKLLGSLCAELYDIEVGINGLSGCARGVLNIGFFNVFNLEFGCYNIPLAVDELMQKIAVSNDQGGLRNYKYVKEMKVIGALLKDHSPDDK